jgi:predicted DNA binding CopG/RHH family protein
LESSEFWASGIEIRSFLNSLSFSSQNYDKYGMLKRMQNPDKAIPDFATEDEERAFWATHDSTEYIDWSKAKTVVFPNLKPTTKSISLRLPESMLNQLRMLANKRDIPYQSLIKLFLKERIDQELRS